VYIYDVYMGIQCDATQHDTLPNQIWSKLGVYSSLFKFIRAKWVLYPHKGKYTTACAPRFLSFRSSPRWYFQRNAMKPLKMDPIVVIVHSTFLFCNLDLCERHILAAISRNIESKSGANLPLLRHIARCHDISSR
jgi:hypothetical protein